MERTAKEFKYQGKRYVLDTIAMFRLIQQMMVDTAARFSRGDRAAMAAMLEPLMYKVAAVEQEYDKREHARQAEEGKNEGQDYHVPSILFEVSVDQNDLPMLLQKLRQAGPFPLNEVLPESEYGDIPVTREGHVLVLFDDTDVVHVRAFLKGDILPKTTIQGSA